MKLTSAAILFAAAAVPLSLPVTSRAQDASSTGQAGSALLDSSPLSDLNLPEGLDPFADAADDVPDATTETPQREATLDVSYDAAAETVEIHVANADLLDVLRMLSVRSRRNIVAGRDVSGTVTCDLYDVTVPEALDAILRSHGFVTREEGN
ncbi:MAG: hypothetical protein AAGK78_10400, partial [Planctomycetota bacterium]